MEATNDDHLVIYSDENGETKIDVRINDETVWLSLNQMSSIFERDKSVISRHIKNLFKEDELEEKATVAFFATVQTEGDRKVERQVEYYNLDIILAVGYRVNSKRGVQFRKWASRVLKEYLIQGYSINNDKLLHDNFNRLKQTVELLSNTLVKNNLVNETGQELIGLIKAYSKTWDMLIRYDENNLVLPSGLRCSGSNILVYEEALDAIYKLKKELTAGNSNLFGLEIGGCFKAILGNIDQTFGGVDLYISSEAKAAHLLYFVIKDHPFSDGNKRIGSLLFLLYLKRAKIDLKNMPSSSITSLALLIAESDPSQKELMIKLVINLISE